MPFAQPLVYILVFLLIVIVGILTAPLWMKAVRNFGRLMKNQLDEGTDAFSPEPKNEDGEVK